MLNKVELYFVAVINGKRRGFFPFLLKPLLRSLSWVFRLFALGRNWAFDKGYLRKYFPPVPLVISVGNIVAGGTGKTPVTLMLAQEFYEQFALAILSRGYRSKAEKLGMPLVLSCGHGPMHLASSCGDEPFMLAQNLPKAHVFVGKNRQEASKMAAKAGAQLILLDDAMQHRWLARDLELVVMDICNPFGHGFFLPRGLLRDNLSSLKRADLIILNHVYDFERLNAVRLKLKKWSQAPVVATKLELTQIFDLNNQPIASLQQRRVAIFCGIAHPEYFANTVENLGAQIVASYNLPDHTFESSQALYTFSQNAKDKGAEWLVCTEKDRVKLEGAIALPLDLAWLKMKLTIVDGQAEWNAFIDRAKQSLALRTN